MKRKENAFSLIQLMVALVLSAIVVIGVFQFFIQGTEEMTDAVRLSALESNVYRAFRSVLTDLKLVGYNPADEFDASGEPRYKLRDPNSRRAMSGPELSYFGFSYYNSDSACLALSHDPSCPLAAPDTDQGANCFCEMFFMNGTTFTKRFFNLAQNTVEDLHLASNSCARFIFWDASANSECECQDGRKCEASDPSGTSPEERCQETAGAVLSPPTAVKFVLASLPDPAYLGDFDDIDPGGGQPVEYCKIDPDTLDPKEYVRFEKIVFLNNLY